MLPGFRRPGREPRFLKGDSMGKNLDPFTGEQMEEHRLEIENRIRNLFWTVSGDYTLEVRPDVEAFTRSRYIALYDAMKQGAFGRYFDLETLELYIMKKNYFSAKERPLLELTQLCVDMAVYPRIAEERPGTKEIRKQAFTDTLEQEEAFLHRSFFGQVKILIMYRCLGKTEPKMSEEVRLAAEKVSELRDAATTDDIIKKIEEIYNGVFDRNFEKEHGNLEQILKVSPMELSDSFWQECLTDEQMEAVIKKYLAGLGKDMMSLNICEKPKKYVHLESSGQRKETESEETAEAAIKRVEEYVELNFGKNYLSLLEQERKRSRLCKGIHSNCILHYTDGILHAPVKKNNQYRFSQLQFEKNRQYYYSNHRVVKRNIKILSDALKKVLVLRNQEDVCRAATGQLAPARLWKLGRTEDEKLFDRKLLSGASEFVVDILLDSSGSQAIRQSQVAIQGYMISEALSAVGIAHRVTGYCTFWNHTILHRFRDYEDQAEKNLRILEFRASGDNRDGLAVKAVYDSLLNRTELHKILIVLSDGKPCDMCMKRPGIKSPADYTGEKAIKDTALEVRRARTFGISVLGIFAGNDEDVQAEKRIFGKDFAYIRNISNFSHIVGIYLRRQLEEE